jgi:hypothetical protein
VIPFAWNQINSKNYTTFFEFKRGGLYQGSFNVPPGNYNVNTFSAAWLYQLQLSIFLLSGYTPNITITYDVSTDKYTFVLQNDPTFTSIKFLNVTNCTQINLCLGFTDEWSITNGLNDSTISTQQVNVNPSRNIYVQSDTLIQKNSYDAYVTPIRTSNIIECIPVYTLPNQYVIFQPPNPTVSVISNPVIDDINLSLGDESLNYPLQDFTLNWSLHLVVEEHRIDLKKTLKEQPPIDINQIQMDAASQAKRKQLEDEKAKIIEKLNKEKNKLISALNSKDVTQVKPSKNP